jgi:hypothetical protein
MPRDLGPAPERILQLTGGAQATALVGAAVESGVFTRLEAGPMTADELAKALTISPRAASALLDGLVALEVITVGDGKYANSPDASAFLVEGKPSSLTGLARVALRGMTDWAKLPQALKTGAPVTAQPSDAKDNPFWTILVPAIAPLALPAAQAVVEQLNVARRGAVSILDVGGGSGIFSAVLLEANRLAEATQVDWPAVNAIARAFVDKLGVGKRFHTVDGDLHTADFGTGHDIAIYSNIAHGESPARNLAAFRKFRKALSSTGTLVISDYVAKDDRSGQRHALLFNSQMLLASKEGASWRVDDYRKWLAEAGFAQVIFAETSGPSTVIYATL